jgi:lactam utilization protein B
MRDRPARVLLLGAVAALLVAAAIGVNVVLLGYADRAPEPAGRLTPRRSIATPSTTPVQTTTTTPTQDDGSRGSERDD